MNWWRISILVATRPVTCTVRSVLGLVGLVLVHWLEEIGGLICNLCLGVAACTIVGADPSPRYIGVCCWDIQQATNKIFPFLSYCATDRSTYALPYTLAIYTPNINSLKQKEKKKKSTLLIWYAFSHTFLCTNRHWWGDWGEFPLCSGRWKKKKSQWDGLV